MNSDVSSDRQRQAAILQILARDWNPSRLREDRAICEYEHYVAEVHRRIVAGVDSSEIATYLLEAEKTRADMDGSLVPGRYAIAYSVATSLVSLKQLTE